MPNFKHLWRGAYLAGTTYLKKIWGNTDQYPVRQLFPVILISMVMACSSAPLDRFSKITTGISKDEVLERVGSPNHTELRDGYEKWSYRFYAGPENDTEELRYINFRDGYVIGYGVDEEEMKRRKQIQEDDDKRIARRKAKETRTSNIPPVDSATAEKKIADEIQKAPEEPVIKPKPKFEEQTGHDGTSERSD